MILLDVNVLVTAMREDAPRHREVKAFVESLRQSSEAFGVSDLVLSGVLRVLTHPRVFSPPTPQKAAREFVEAIRSTSNVIIVSPGDRHWELFMLLVEESGAIGNLVSDAWHAALAIEHGCEWVTSDTDFSRFPGLRWRKPV